MFHRKIQSDSEKQISNNCRCGLGEARDTPTARGRPGSQERGEMNFPPEVTGWKDPVKGPGPGAFPSFWKQKLGTFCLGK